MKWERRVHSSFVNRNHRVIAKYIRRNRLEVKVENVEMNSFITGAAFSASFCLSVLLSFMIFMKDFSY